MSLSAEFEARVRSGPALRRVHQNDVAFSDFCSRESMRQPGSRPARRWNWLRASTLLKLCSAGSTSRPATSTKGSRNWKKPSQMTSSPASIPRQLWGTRTAKNGERGKAQAIIAELNQMSSQRYVSPLCAAIVYIGLGDKNRALDGSGKGLRGTLAVAGLSQNRYEVGPGALRSALRRVAEKSGPRQLTARRLDSLSLRCYSQC